MPDDDRSAPSRATAPKATKNAVSMLTVREMILIAMELFLRHAPKTSEAPPSISKAVLTFVVWSFFPESFGMRLNGLVPDELSWTTPDSNRVQAKLSGSDGIRGLGWVTEIEGETGTEYILTDAGHKKARALLKKLRGIPPKPQIEPTKEILKVLKIQEAFAAMKAALAGKEKIEEEEEEEDAPVTNTTDAPSKPASERKLGQQPPETPKESPMEMVAPPKIPVAMEPPTPPPPPDPPPPPSPPREPISNEDLHVLTRLAETPIAKSIFRKAPSGEESRTFLNRFDPNPNTSATAKMASLAELVRRVDSHLTDDGTLEQIRRAILAVSRVVDAISTHFRAAA